MSECIGIDISRTAVGNRHREAAQADQERAAQPAIAADKRVRARFALPHTLAAEWHVGLT